MATEKKQIRSKLNIDKVIPHIIGVVKSTKTIALSEEDLLTRRVAKNASSTAIRISRALELPLQYIENGKLVEENARGEKRTIKEIKKIKSNLDLSKGIKIWLKPRD